jgi:hypothetical protein
MITTSQTRLVDSTGSSASYLRAPATKRIAWLEKNLPNPDDQREYARDRCIVAFTEALGEIMVQSDLSRTALAEKLGKSPSQISRLLNGGQNMTLRTVADVLWACDMEVVDPALGFGPLGVIEVAINDATGWQPVGMDAFQPRPPPFGVDQTLVWSIMVRKSSANHATNFTL